MAGETEKSHEAAPMLRIGDEVIYLPDSSRQVVMGQVVGSVAKLAKIARNSEGLEILEHGGTEDLDDIGEVVGHWEYDRIIEARLRWLENWNLGQEAKDKIRRALDGEIKKQQASEEAE